MAETTKNPGPILVRIGPERLWACGPSEGGKPGKRMIADHMASIDLFHAVCSGRLANSYRPEQNEYLSECCVTVPLKPRQGN